MKTYKVIVSYKINGLVKEEGECVTYTTKFKGTNSKNKYFIPESLLELLINSGNIKPLVLCD